MEESSPQQPSATHPVLRYFCEKKNQEKWEVVFEHPIAEAFQEKTVSFFQEGTVYGQSTQLLLKSPAVNGEKEKKKGKKQNCPPIQCGSFLHPDIQTLMEKSRPSSFGRGDETVYDEDIRKGRELCPDVLDVSIYERNLPQDEIKRSLFPNSSLEFKFSKLAIYEPGGHFHVHRDTVRSHDHQGTLLIEVRSTHTGGDLVLEHNGEEVQWSLASNDSDLTGNLVRYIAFFTDVNHRVEPILSGVRLVLQYDIYATPMDEAQQSKRQKSVPWEEDDDSEGFFTKTSVFSQPISNALTTKLLDLIGSCITNEQSISFPHFYLYTDTQLLPSRLKWKDQQIFSALLNHGYHVLMIPVEIVAISNYEGSFRGDNPTYKIRSLSSSDHGYLLQDGMVTSKKHTPESILYVATGFEQLVQLDHTPYSEHTGNEPAPAEYKYFQSVFVVSTRSATLENEV
jgi:hypothetical protein